MEENNFIKCPYCGTEYLPGEIFYPKHYLGQPKDVEKSLSGEILIADGIPQCCSEEYACDKCGKSFKVLVSHSYTVSKLDENNFDDDFTISLFDDRITLEEI